MLFVVAGATWITGIARQISGEDTTGMLLVEANIGRITRIMPTI